MSIGLITGVFGDYDHPNELIPNHGFDRAIFVTDNTSLVVPGWEMVYDDYPELHSRHKSKVPKSLVTEYLDTDQSVWIDGSMKLESPEFVDVAKEKLKHDDIVMLNHKACGRTDAYQEAEFCYDLAKYKDQPLREQVEAYRNAGYPENYGLWQTGILARNHTEQIEIFGVEWLMNIFQWSYQDQVSFSYLAWKFDIIPGTWYDEAKPWWFNPWIKFTGHKREEK